RLLPPRRCVKLPQGPLEVWEVAGAEHLDARIMLTVEPGHCIGALSRRSRIWRTEPQPKVECVDWLSRRVLVSIGERWLIMDEGRRLVPRGLRHDECLDAEAADEQLGALSISVGLDVTLIPG